MKETITWRDVAHLAEHNDKIRIVQETVAGKEITFAHVIGGPAPIIYQKLGLNPAIDYGAAAIGIITKIDSPFANVPMVRSWMINSGCERIFEVSSFTREGIQDLIDYLKDDPVKLTLEEAKDRQRQGIPEWRDPDEWRREMAALPRRA